MKNARAARGAVLLLTCLLAGCSNHQGTNPAPETTVPATSVQAAPATPSQQPVSSQPQAAQPDPTSTGGSQATPSYEDVDPAQFFGRDGLPIFNVRTHSNVVNFCGLQESSLFCGGIGPAGSNQVNVTAESIEYYVGEGPLEPNLEFLEPGQRISFGDSQCAVHQDNAIECRVGDNAIYIDPTTRSISEQ